MNGYAPSSPRIVLALAAIVALSILVGFALTRRRVAGGRLAAWLMLIATLFAAERFTVVEPGGLRMLALCAALFFGFKAVVGTAHLAAGGTPVLAARWFGFVLTWPGMNPATFAEPRRAAPGGPGLVRRGVLEAAAGAALITSARFVWLATRERALATLLLLVGLSLVGHFGLFSISAGLWRLRGVRCESPFQAPLAATSLSTFWARRWNRPFSELVRLTIYRPLASVLGPAAGVYAGFLLSGILHEVALSVPARAGYGRPLAYFAIQGAFVLIEKRYTPGGLGWRRRFMVLLALILPLPLLLIPQFLHAAVWPILGVA
jgi:alginate O-acetyltransferase complex protein AlgI